MLFLHRVQLLLLLLGRLLEALLLPQRIDGDRIEHERRFSNLNFLRLRATTSSPTATTRLLDAHGLHIVGALLGRTHEGTRIRERIHEVLESVRHIDLQFDVTEQHW
uniref:Putative secreted protein n=1 Tax=Anopheles darlingi TaxID=43151 RepID=A0A2M4D446_ANODA